MEARGKHELQVFFKGVTLILKLKLLIINVTFMNYTIVPDHSGMVEADPTKRSAAYALV